jgi:hypothetical protein
MIPKTDTERLQVLMEKGGMMFFTIDRPMRVYRGMVALSPVKNNFRNRDVFIKEYKYTLQGGQNEKTTA